MRVYLVANSGGTTAFKITTAHVYTSLDNVVEHTLKSLINNRPWRYDDRTILDELLRLTWGPNIYYANIDDLENKAKKFTDDKLWRKTVEEFMSKYPDKVQDVEQKRKEKWGK